MMKNWVCWKYGETRRVCWKGVKIRKSEEVYMLSKQENLQKLKQDVEKIEKWENMYVEKMLQNKMCRRKKN